MWVIIWQLLVGVLQVQGIARWRAGERRNVLLSPVNHLHLVDISSAERELIQNKFTLLSSAHVGAHSDQHPLFHFWPLGWPIKSNYYHAPKVLASLSDVGWCVWYLGIFWEGPVKPLTNRATWLWGWPKEYIGSFKCHQRGACERAMAYCLGVAQ